MYLQFIKVMNLKKGRPMNVKLIVFSLAASFAVTNVFAIECGNKMNHSEEVQQQKVDQKIIPKSYNYIQFDNQTGEGNKGIRNVTFDTMNMTFSVAANKAVRELQLPGDYDDYVWKNSKGKVLDFNQSCTSQGVVNASTVTVTK